MQKVRLRPTSNRLVVRQHVEDSKTPSGIIIPDNAKEKLMKGTVLEAGPGEHGDENEVKKGDEIMFGQYAGSDITLNGEKLLLMRENDVYGIVEYINEGDEGMEVPDPDAISEDEER